MNLAQAGLWEPCGVLGAPKPIAEKLFWKIRNVLSSEPQTSQQVSALVGCNERNARKILWELYNAELANTAGMCRNFVLWIAK